MQAKGQYNDIYETVKFQHLASARKLNESENGTVCKKDIQQQTQAMRQAIVCAKDFERGNPLLRRFLEQKIPALHRSISLPKEDTVASLESFITSYIESVPDFIEALHRLAEEAGVSDRTEQFLAIAADFFLSPPEIVDQVPGLKGLLGEAYLAHRLIEEINDRMMMASGVPFSPMDMTLSNVIVQDILDHEFANQLDLAVHYAIESLFDNKAAFKDADFTDYLKKQQTKGWSEAISNWPCLAGDSEITLKLAPGLAF